MALLQTGTRFIVIGLACAVLHNIIMLSLDRFNVHYVLSSAASYLVVVGTGYALHASVTFREPKSLRAFLRYAVAMAANYPATVALLFLMCDLVGLPIIIAVPVATVIMLAWNFFASRWSIASRAEPTGDPRVRPEGKSPSTKAV